MPENPPPFSGSERTSASSAFRLSREKVLETGGKKNFQSSFLIIAPRLIHSIGRVDRPSAFSRNFYMEANGQGVRLYVTPNHNAGQVFCRILFSSHIMGCDEGGEEVFPVDE